MIAQPPVIVLIEIATIGCVDFPPPDITRVEYPETVLSLKKTRPPETAGFHSDKYTRYESTKI